jgi:hypothetical protein
LALDPYEASAKPLPDCQIARLPDCQIARWANVAESSNFAAQLCCSALVLSFGVNAVGFFEE